MSVKSKQIKVEDLAVGMFISQLDIPWSQSPFPIQGFYIRSVEQISEIAKHSKLVFIDVVKSQSVGRWDTADSKQKINKTAKRSVFARAPEKPNTSQRGAPPAEIKPLPIRHNRYPIELTAKKELKAAKKIQQQMLGALQTLLSQVKTERQVDIQLCKKVGKEVVDSVLRNPDALMWVTRLQHHDEQMHRKSIQCLVWALVFGRHLGLDRKRLEILSCAMLLGCIGMVDLPKELITQQSPLDAEQTKQFSMYVNYSVKALMDRGYANSALVEVVGCQQERHDGSGYPRGLKGDEICLLGKIGGLVGYFDSLLSPLHGGSPLTTTEACAQIYSLKGVKFQAQLVDEFISAISIYPTGSVVELTTNEIGLIVSRHDKRKLLPKVLIIFDANGRRVARPKVIDLLARNKNRDQFIAIKKSLNASEVDIDLAEYVDYKESSWLSMVV
ncbi:MAG: hypothetical protein COB04_11960 [Gammaproteobacteria bacterium]|nr:MAG: hypothetical protein COB04_11960 [Gammaproteobacteria bacterium]